MITIDQRKINAPGFPRDQEWWRRFTPEWAAVTVNGDTVTLEPSGLAMRYTAERGVWWEPSADQSPTAYTRREQILTKWLTRNPRLAVAVISQPGNG